MAPGRSEVTRAVTQEHLLVAGLSEGSGALHVTLPVGGTRATNTFGSPQLEGRPRRPYPVRDLPPHLLRRRGECARLARLFQKWSSGADGRLSGGAEGAGSGGPAPGRRPPRACTLLPENPVVGGSHGDAFLFGPFLVTQECKGLFKGTEQPCFFR